MLAAGYKPPVRPRGEEQREKLENPSFKARRRGVETCHSWFNRIRFSIDPLGGSNHCITEDKNQNYLWISSKSNF
jgi:hypothetical protein